MLFPLKPEPAAGNTPNEISKGPLDTDNAGGRSVDDRRDKSDKTEKMSKKCIVLTSNMATGLNLTAQKNMVDKLDGQKVVYENVEAVEQVDKRNELFGISGKKGLFPQVGGPEAVRDNSVVICNDLNDRL